MCFDSPDFIFLAIMDYKPRILGRTPCLAFKLSYFHPHPSTSPQKTDIFSCTETIMTAGEKVKEKFYYVKKHLQLHQA